MIYIHGSVNVSTVTRRAFYIDRIMLKKTSATSMTCVYPQVMFIDIKKEYTVTCHTVFWYDILLRRSHNARCQHVN